ncbi:DUF3592 domain-containing protein [Alkalimarinus sediminis]|uniref:DUF3592 domain-containing protein n=1 Tax=Alkalimarinus sediminis TaxID=1632866 RepID=A0A9E8HLE0_9ALTE|nr:DUF3592 domain-containing protein [Alkalimarinus sediminis]UZW75001.1 DUF3592 domain-containing protein [Alkalimarinus sediminis]
MKMISTIKYLFGSIGLAMLVGMLFIYQSNQSFLATAHTAEGTIIDFVRSRSENSTTYAPVIAFYAQDGEETIFTSSSFSSPGKYSINEKVELLYQPANPIDAKINSFFSLWGGCMIVGILGSSFFSVGLIITLVGRSKKKRINDLKNNGTPIETTFQSVEINGSLVVNGSSPYQIHTQWTNPENAKLHIFKSENIWFDPSNHIKNDKITVLIDRNNPKKYYVDTSFLPEVAA